MFSAFNRERCAMRALVLAALCLLVAVPCDAFLIRVNIYISEYPELYGSPDYQGDPPLYAYQVATGGFTFDSDYFVLQPNPDYATGYNYRGIVPMDDLENAGLDFYTGALAGTHWDILSDVRLYYHGYFPITEGQIHLPMWDWEWDASVGGHWGIGGDGHTFGMIGNRYYTTWWDGGAITEDDQGEDEQASLPEPPPAGLFGIGLLAIVLVTRRNWSTKLLG